MNEKQLDYITRISLIFLVFAIVFTEVGVYEANASAISKLKCVTQTISGVKNPSAIAEAIPGLAESVFTVENIGAVAVVGAVAYATYGTLEMVGADRLLVKALDKISKPTIDVIKNGMVDDVDLTDTQVKEIQSAIQDTASKKQDFIETPYGVFPGEMFFEKIPTIEQINQMPTSITILNGVNVTTERGNLGDWQVYFNGVRTEYYKYNGNEIAIHGGDMDCPKPHFLLQKNWADLWELCLYSVKNGRPSKTAGLLIKPTDCKTVSVGEKTLPKAKEITGGLHLPTAYIKASASEVVAHPMVISPDISKEWSKGVEGTKDTTKSISAGGTATAVDEAFADKILSKVWAGIKYMFVPPPNTFTEMFNELKEPLEDKLFADPKLQEEFKKVQNEEFNDITINVKEFTGKDKEVVIVSSYYVKKLIKFIRMGTSCLSIFLLMLYIYNQVYFLIRGVRPIQPVKGGNDEPTLSELSKINFDDCYK